ncbi:MAG: aspartate--tRNA(Asn) ligase, partial [Thermoprotei archaeon]
MVALPVKVCGWVNSKREVGGIVFLEVVPGLQLRPVVVVAKRDEDEAVWRAAKGVRVGSAVEVVGEFKERSISRRGREMRPTSVRVLSEPMGKLPIDVTGKAGALLDTKIEYRYLTLRLPRERAVFKV